MAEPTKLELTVPDHDLEYLTCRGSGKGGQHRNVTDSAVQLRHLPTGLMVRCEGERSQHQNKASALVMLRARLWQAQQENVAAARASDRLSQVGSGMRGDKTWTVRSQDGVVTHHASGRKFRLHDYLSGDYEV